MKRSKQLNISIVVDTPGSWMNGHTGVLIDALRAKGHEARACGGHDEVRAGDIAFFLSCERIISPETMKKNSRNIVVHASDLPRGRGWSPLTWQVLEGRDRIPVTMFEAADKVDSGPVYLRDEVPLEGHELIGEMRAKLVETMARMILRFVDAYPNIHGEPQEGEPTCYGKRAPKDSELDPNKSIAAQFNLLRVADNEKYPAFFTHRGHRYVLRICKEEGGKAAV